MIQELHGRKSCKAVSSVSQTSPPKRLVTRDELAKLTLQNGENHSFVKSDSVDFVLTDPPFNISKQTNFASYAKNTIHSYQFDDNSQEDWDSYSHPEFLSKLEEWSGEWARVLRKGGNFAVFCADAYISHLIEALKRNGLSPRRVITWRKNNAVPVNRQYMPMSANEYIIVGVKPGKNVTFNADIKLTHQNLDERIVEATVIADKVSTIIYTQVREALLSGNLLELDEQNHIASIKQTVEDALEYSKKEALKKTEALYKVNAQGEKYLQACIPNYVQNPLKVGNRLHPTEKPVALLQYLVSLYSKENDTVLDAFGGSGSTGEAALSLNRNAIVVEREPTYFEKLRLRLEPLASNTDLL